MIDIRYHTAVTGCSICHRAYAPNWASEPAQLAAEMGSSVYRSGPDLEPSRLGKCNPEGSFAPHWS
jgi:hypothetical protein